MTVASTAQSLFARHNTDAGSASQRATIARAVQKFEGLLWDQVLQVMSNVHLGPTGLGYGGQLYQSMLWQKVASKDFSQTDKALTRATLNQLLPASTAKAADVSSSRAPAAVDSASPQPSPAQWVRDVWGAIKAGAQQLGVPAEGLLAQAALETGWGQHVTGNNMFGVKAHGNGASFTALTHEFDGNTLRQVHAAFRDYPSAAHAVADLVQVLQHYHPQVVGQPTVAAYAQALQNSGYATDPRYAAKIMAVAQSPRMHELLSQVKESAAPTNITSS